MKRNLFDPKAWANILVGNKAFYIAWNIVTLCWSFFIIFELYEKGIRGYSIYIVTFGATCFFPLSYLRSLRVLCKDNLNCT